MPIIDDGMTGPQIRANINALEGLQEMDIASRALIEGDPGFLAANNATSAVSVATGAVNTTVATTGGYPRIGKVLFVEQITMSLDKAAIAQANIPADGSARFAGVAPQVLVAAGVPVVMPVRQIIRPVHFASGAITLSVRNNLTGGSLSYIGTITATGRTMTDDFNFTADHTIMVAGDSTTNGTGPTATQTMYPFLVREWLNSQGYNCRVLLKSASGTTSAEHETFRKQGWHSSTLNKYSLGIYNLGINDAGGAVSSATFLANVTAFWNWWSKAYPNAPLIILGPTPLENNTTEAAAATYRSAVAAWVTSVNSPRLAFADPTALWDRAVTANYAGSDTPGSRVHYVDAPHALVAGLIQTTISSGNLWPAR